jgi:tetratricopeptide (TPR) repeat protein
LLFQPTGADNAPPTANASPAPRISVANSRPMLVRDRPSNIDNRRPPNITRMQPQASAAEKAELALVNQKATQLIQQGFLLAERGATYSARSQFQEALWMVAEALDAQEGSDYHSRSLAAGLTAAREAGEFAVRQRRGEEGVDIAHVAAGHRTAILKEGRAKGVNALRAQQMYLSFAQEQLTIAASRQAAASQALYGMGRLAAVAANGGDGKLGDVGVAAVCFQAALVADGRNFRAANELGVLLANHGRLPAAVDAFERCLQVSPEPVAWRNLASAYAMLGKKELADRALAQANAVPATNNSPTNVQWLEPSRFADTVTQDSLSAPLAAKPQVTAPPAKGRPGVTARLPGPKSASSR